MTAPAIQVGERVRHRNFPACGIGKIVEILGNGKIKAKFPDNGHTLVGVEGFVFIDREAANVAKKNQKEALRSKFLADIDLKFKTVAASIQ